MRKSMNEFVLVKIFSVFDVKWKKKRLNALRDEISENIIQKKKRVQRSKKSMKQVLLLNVDFFFFWIIFCEVCLVSASTRRDCNWWCNERKYLRVLLYWILNIKFYNLSINITTYFNIFWAVRLNFRVNSHWENFSRRN